MNYQILPPLSASESAALQDDIAKRGVQVPIEMDDQGNVLDGHHRLRICKKLGISDYPTIIRVGMDDDEKLEHILALNLARRHLTREQRRELVAALRNLKWSTRKIADRVGISRQTALNDLSGVKNLTTDLPDRVTGKDGKSYRARKPSVIAKTPTETKQALNALAQVDTEALPKTILDTRRVKRLAREHEAIQRAREFVATDMPDGDVQLLLGDIRERRQEIPDESVALIFTEPPSSQESLPLWSELAKLASRVLKPNGILIACSWAMYLPEVMDRLAQHLSFWWIGTMVFSPRYTNIKARHIRAGSKPMLFYVHEQFTANHARVPFTPGPWIEDTTQRKDVSKPQGGWQRDRAPAIYYIGKLTKPGETILDPFMGTGTAGIAAAELGRSFIGIECKAALFAQAQRNILNA